MAEAVKSLKGEAKMALKIEKTRKARKSKKSKKTNLTRVHFILDESGSMGGARQNTIDGFNEYINTLRNDDTGNKYRISLTKFEGGNIVNLFDYVKLENVKDITEDDYTPCGMTNLNDAIGFTMMGMKSKGGKKKQNTLIIVMTDGLENASREWTQDTIANLIKEQEKEGWTVTFLGANMDAQKVSQAYAIHENNARSFTTTGMGNVMAHAATATVMYANSSLDAGGAISMDNVFEEAQMGASIADWAEEDKIKDKVKITGLLNLTSKKDESNV